MANITLYSENEDNWFATECLDKRNRVVTVDVFSTTQDGAQNRLDQSARDYDLVDVGDVEKIGSADKAAWFNR